MSHILRSEAHDCEVTSQERVAIEAGDFDTFKVMCNSEWRQRVYYFSPELNNIVVERTIHKTEPERNSGWELVEVSS